MVLILYLFVRHATYGSVCYTHFTPMYRMRRKRMERSFSLSINEKINGKQHLSLIDREKIPSIIFLLILHTGVKWIMSLHLQYSVLRKSKQILFETFGCHSIKSAMQYDVRISKL